MLFPNLITKHIIKSFLPLIEHIDGTIVIDESCIKQTTTCKLSQSDHWHLLIDEEMQTKEPFFLHYRKITLSRFLVMRLWWTKQKQKKLKQYHRKTFIKVKYGMTLNPYVVWIKPWLITTSGKHAVIRIGKVFFSENPTNIKEIEELQLFNFKQKYKCPKQCFFFTPERIEK